MLPAVLGVDASGARRWSTDALRCPSQQAVVEVSVTRLAARQLGLTAADDRGGVFVVGRAYTRAEMRDALGGPKQTHLPTVAGEVVAVCLGTDKKPQAPERILVGTKQRVVAAPEQRSTSPARCRVPEAPLQRVGLPGPVRRG